jgi:DNA-binding winged helix-turn-helix (wHTH) protein/tetratricopeptide (TPR) repeat protein
MRAGRICLNHTIRSKASTLKTLSAYGTGGFTSQPMPTQRLGISENAKVMRTFAMAPALEFPPPTGSGLIYEFGEFRLDPANRLLTSDGKEVALPGRSFDALLLLVQKRGSLLTKQEMMERVWHDSFVEESNLTVAISTLRRALREDPHDRRYIQTVSGRGYRFISEVHKLQAVSLEEEPTLAVIGSAASAGHFAPADPPSPAPPGNIATPANTLTAQLSPAATSSTRTKTFIAAAAVLAASIAAGLAIYHLAGFGQIKVRSLAILPFSQQGGAADEFQLLGMTDTLISELGDEVEVRPTSSVLDYAHHPVEPRVAGRDQGVDAVLTGDVRRSGAETAIVLNLVRTQDGTLLWHTSVTSRSNDLAKLQGATQQAVIAELRRLAPRDRPKSHVTTAFLPQENEQAYQLYMRGRYFWNRRTEEGLKKSIEYFRQAIAIDPNFALAYAGLADSYALQASFSVEPGSSANADARAAALSAIQINPQLAEPYASLGMIDFFTAWDGPQAEKEFEKSILLNPNYATAHHWFALDLAAMGRMPEALYEIRRAQQLDPLSLIIDTNVGWIEYLSHDYAASARELKRVLELDPGFFRARMRLGMLEMQSGNPRAAVNDLTLALKLSGDDPYVAGLLGQAQAMAGDVAAAKRSLAAVEQRAHTAYVPPISRALVLLGLGRKQDALTALEQAVDDRSTSMVYAKVDPAFDSLRADPRFEKLLSRMSF